MSSSPAPAPSRARQLALFRRALLAAAFVPALLRLADPAVLGTTDFQEYWAAGRLNAAGENPYSPERMLALQKEAGSAKPEPVMMYNPPWLLPLVMPFGLLPYGPGRALWLALNLAVIMVCCDRLWRLYGGGDRERWLAWLLGLTFFPTLCALQMGQITPLMLAGVLGFLEEVRRGRDGRAGAWLALTLLKPHVVYLPGLALLLWCRDRRRWGVPATALLTAGGATAAALTFNPHAVTQFWHVLVHRPPAECLSPSLGAALRLAFGMEHFWLQFLPPLLGVLWLVPYWGAHRKTWDWAEGTPLLLLTSLLTSAYGAWAFDLVVLLPAVMQAAIWAYRAGGARLRASAGVAYLTLNVLALGMNQAGVQAFGLIWLTPALLLLYLGVRRQACVPGATAPVPAVS
jgi:hypothetical protein